MASLAPQGVEDVRHHRVADFFAMRMKVGIPSAETEGQEQQHQMASEVKAMTPQFTNCVIASAVSHCGRFCLLIV